MNRHAFRLFCFAVAGLGVALAAAAEPEVRVGTYDFRPLVYARSENADDGLFLGVLAAVARAEQWKLRLVPGTLNDGWARLATGEIDLIVAAPYREEYTAQYTYSRESVFSTWAQVYVPRRRKLETILDLAGRTVAVCQSDPYAAELTGLARGFSVSCTIVECKNNADVLNAVSRQWVDAGVVDRLYGVRYERLYEVTRTSVLFAPIDLRFATARGQNADLLNRIDYAVRKMKENPASVYHTLVNRTLGQDVTAGHSEWVRLALAGAGTLGLGALLIIVRLRRQVAQTTGRLSEKEQHLAAEIHSRRRAESDVREFSQLLENIFSTLRDGILLVDPAWQTIIRSNPCAAAMFGVARAEELLDIHPAALFPSPETFSARIAQIMSGISTDGFSRQELNLSRQNGQPFPAELVVSPIRDGQRLICFLVVIRDTTEQMASQMALLESEKRLRQAQKMEAIGTLAGGIAHDLNNIITPILCGAELLLANEPPASPRRDDIDTIRSAGLRARDLIRQILAFSRPQESDRQPLRVTIVVKEALKFLRSALPATVEIRESLLAKNDTVLANPVQIHQVLLNLCTNASHAMREKGGVLEVSLSDFDGTPRGIAGVAEPPAGRYLVLSVRDTGHGIAAALLERIFDPFFTTKKAGEGTGMGLAMVHGIVRSCGGCIAVVSEPGRGSTFRVFLPSTNASAETVPAQSLAAVTGKERVLIVDDEVPLGRMLGRSLERLGYRSVVCQSPSKAIDLFQEKPDEYDLIISDLTMPVMNGLQLAGELHRIRPDVPIILCSGNCEDSVREEAHKVGIQAFLHKPFSADELATVIRQLTDKTMISPDAALGVA